MADEKGKNRLEDELDLNSILDPDLDGEGFKEDEIDFDLDDILAGDKDIFGERLPADAPPPRFDSAPDFRISANNDRAPDEEEFDSELEGIKFDLEPEPEGEWAESEPEFTITSMADEEYDFILEDIVQESPPPWNDAEIIPAEPAASVAGDSLTEAVEPPADLVEETPAAAVPEIFSEDEEPAEGIIEEQFQAAPPEETELAGFAGVEDVEEAAIEEPETPLTTPAVEYVVEEEAAAPLVHMLEEYEVKEFEEPREPVEEIGRTAYDFELKEVIMEPPEPAEAMVSEDLTGAEVSTETGEAAEVIFEPAGESEERPVAAELTGQEAEIYPAAPQADQERLEEIVRETVESAVERILTGMLPDLIEKIVSREIDRLMAELENE